MIKCYVSIGVVSSRLVSVGLRPPLTSQNRYWVLGSLGSWSGEGGSRLSGATDPMLSGDGVNSSVVTFKLSSDRVPKLGRDSKEPTEVNDMSLY